jgi:hypothetical protein
MTDAEPCPDGPVQLELVRKGVNAALDALAEVLALPHPCRCRWCSWRASYPTVAEANAAIDAHVAGCAVHPIRAVERQRDWLAGRVAELEEALRKSAVTNRVS